MEIKKIKLSAKRGGNGYVSSYSVNIGSNEARTCGLVSAEHPILLCKVVDDENEQIIIKPKRYTLTNETVQSVISTADQLRKISDLQLGPVPCVIQGIIDISDIPEPDEDVRRAEAELERVLMDLSYEEVTDLVTLMLIGREDDADMTLEGPERFLDYWGYLSERGVFNAKESLVDYMVEKMRKEGLLEKLERILSVKTDIVHVGICTEIIDEQTHKKVLCPKIQEIVDFLQKNNIKVVFGTHK